MMTKLEKPVWMTVKEANEKYYPNTYVMINCEVDTGLPIAGEVVAYAPLKNNGGEISKLKSKLARSGKYGVVDINQTKDPLDGGALSKF